ncbi:hypothetical protein [Mycolicibacterium alvei]|nr:hypothetical protein [Mycolicibacterium alvei]
MEFARARLVVSDSIFESRTHLMSEVISQSQGGVVLDHGLLDELGTQVW